VEQVVLQAVAPHAYGLQELVTGAGQEPAPLQLALAVATPAEQLAPRHCAVGYAQAAVFAPSQDPPQEDPSVAQAGRAPCGGPATATHAPTLPATLHAWHCPPQAWLQQNPSTQLPLAHWLGAAQASPFACFGTHAPLPLQ
jgi:hypothetical protein